MYAENYRERCFEHHTKKCIICGEKSVLDVHHIDGDRSNNSPLNCVPVCPNCHRKAHSNDFKDFMKDQIGIYMEIFEDYYFNQEKY